ncbi:50S ribosomal protein L31 [Patescibacteria group bacterium]|nr:50S ribosomal protein L31 [Patescibacteria group bacterium]
MKKDIQPEFYNDATVTCSSCGKVFKSGGTVKELTTDVCSNCHSFYTGKANLVDTSGRVDKFKKRSNAKVENYQELKSKKKNKRRDNKIKKVNTIESES